MTNSNKSYIDVDYLKNFWSRIKSIVLNTNYSELNTTNKTIIGSINELRQTSAGYTLLSSNDNSVGITDNGDNSFDLTVQMNFSSSNDSVSITPDPILPNTFDLTIEETSPTIITSNDKSVSVKTTGGNAFDLSMQVLLESAQNTVYITPDSAKPNKFNVEIDPTVIESSDQTISITSDSTTPNKFDITTEQTVLTSDEDTIEITQDETNKQTFNVDVKLIPNEWALDKMDTNTDSSVGSKEEGTNTDGWILGKGITSTTSYTGGVVMGNNISNVEVYGGGLLLGNEHSNNIVTNGGILEGYKMINNNITTGGINLGYANNTNTVSEGGVLLGYWNKNNNIKKGNVVLGSGIHNLITSDTNPVVFLGSGCAKPTLPEATRFVVGGGTDLLSKNVAEIDNNGNLILRGDIILNTGGSYRKISDLLNVSNPSRWPTIRSPWVND